jgi:hypothetical protein
MKFGENVVKQPQGLIEVLLDVTAAEADRDDAAMDLAAYDEPEVEDATTPAPFATPGRALQYPERRSRHNRMGEEPWQR